MTRIALALNAALIASLQTSGAVAFRFDDNHAPDDWRAVAEVFESEGLRCSFAVVNGALNDALYWDRLHPRDAGYEVWADEILQLLNKQSLSRSNKR